MLQPKRAADILGDLHSLGVRVSIDDFGTGYSSLAYLKDFPVDEIKVDRSFVAGMGTHRKDRVIVQAIVDLGHNLGLEVVAGASRTAPA
jgi:EAL domain-containing protein (putative c-di-GMP-specific phosphodiesterase class I)